MTYWQKLASQLGESDPHPWEQMYADTIALTDPQMVENLSKKGDLDAFVKVKVSEALDSYQRYLDDDMDPQMAKELALEELMPSDDDDASEEEIEDGMEDDMNAVMGYLLKGDEGEEEYDDEDMAPMDFEDEEDMAPPKRMALQVGSVINKNGQQYRLNENHRWTKVERGGQSAPQTARPQQQQQQPQKPQQPQPQRPVKPNAAPKPQNKAPQAPAAPMQPKPQASPQASQSVFQGQHNPQVESDPNHDGVADRARVGVPAFDVPPPPRKIPRIPGLSGLAAKAENAFASKFESDPDDLTDRAVVMFTALAETKGQPPTFETDACKLLCDHWNSTTLDGDLARRSKNRATLNTALHQTANAICKRAFMKHMDTMEEGQEILVTVGGCGAGKGYGLEKDEATGQPRVPVAYNLAQRANAVWDSAGDQNATENPWILQEARKRGLRVSYVFVHADPKVSWADPKRGVVQRATKPENGRMVDALVFADSYAMGAKNHHAFSEKHRHDPDVTFMFLKNGNPPEVLNEMPKEALAVDRRELAKFAVDTIKQRTDLPEHVLSGALAGTEIWKD
jgi:hypothetical protein